MADLQSTLKIIDKALTNLTKGLVSVEPKFKNLVVKWVQEFDNENGNLSSSKANKTRLAGFQEAVNGFYVKSGYGDLVKSYLKSVPQISSELQSIHKDLNEIDLTKEFINDFQRFAIETITDAMLGQGMSEALVNPLQNQMFISITQGASLDVMIKSIAQQLTTTEQRQGILKKTALQVSRDALRQYEGTVNGAVKIAYNLDSYLYIGSLVKDSRPQCERWVNWDKNGKKGLLLESELEEQIQWAFDNGTGMIPSTTVDSFASDCGGFNCRHTTYPVRSSVYKK